MAQIVWSKLAQADLENIHEYIARDSPYFAQKTIEEFFIAVTVLLKYPEVGREVPEFLRKDTREIIQGNYRFFYKFRRKNIFIIRVHHSAQNISLKGKSTSR